MDAFQFRKHVVSQKDLARELINICDAYRRRDIGDKEIFDTVNYYATNFPGKLFNGKEYNSTISAIIGIKRLNLIKSVLGEKVNP